MGFFGNMMRLWFSNNGNSQISPDASPSSGKYALDSSATRLLDFEERRGKLEADIMDLEKTADEIYFTLTNHTSYLIMFNGGWFILQNIPTKISAYIVTPALIVPFIIALFYLISSAKVKLLRLIPRKFSLITKKCKLSQEADELRALEDRRIANVTNDDDGTLLHPLVEAEYVVRRCEAIINSRDVPPIEKSHHWLIMHAIFSGVLHVAFLFFILYLTYWGIPNEVIGGIWSETPVNLVAAS